MDGEERTEEQKKIPLLLRENLEDPVILNHYIHENLENDYYWSGDWSPEFYIELAYQGFISVAMEHEELGALLLPEIQQFYALLDWKNLHYSRKVRKRIKSGGLENYYLTIDQDFEPVLEGISRSFDSRCWLIPPYRKLLKKVAALENNPRDLRLLGVKLWEGETLVAGELGYILGKTYTSLTGFFNRREARYSHMGTIQLLTLGELLAGRGYAFWNLGHPQLQYKIDLGAEVFGRKDFLLRWKEERDGPAPVFPRARERFYCRDLLNP